jgi:hypothetical protein
MDATSILTEAVKLGLEHTHARLTGSPYWKHRDVTAPLFCADDFAEAARHFADELFQLKDNETASKLLELAESYESMTESSTQ